ncbi:MAG: tetratricopeptide repeat protein [Deltaproteobacteria bacterium]|nr:tetratricopeptide repeat protein [Deltaproteobacteria bacterium]
MTKDQGRAVEHRASRRHSPGRARAHQGLAIGAFRVARVRTDRDAHGPGVRPPRRAGTARIVLGRAVGLPFLSTVLFGIVFVVALAAARPAAAEAARHEAAKDVEAEVRAGWKAVDQNRLPDARRHFEYALAHAPPRADVHAGIGEVLFGLGELKESLKHFERAAALAPGLERAHFGIGRVCLKLFVLYWYKPRTRVALLARAESEFTRLLELNPKHEGARQSMHSVKHIHKLFGRSLLFLQLTVATLLVLLITAVTLRLRARGLPRARAFLWPLVLFAVTRMVLFSAFALAPHMLSEVKPHPRAILYDSNRFVLDSVAGRWDSNLYSEVAFFSYRMPVPGSFFLWGTVGQFPLLPVLLRWLAFVLDDAFWAAAIIPNAALLLATLFLFDWLRTEHGQRLAIGTVCVLLVHPASMHGSVLYAESLALLGMVGVVHSLQRGAYASAGLWGVFAGLARFNTLAIVPWMLLEAWRKPAGRSPGSLLARISPLFGVALFMLYLQVEFGNAFAYFHEVSVTRFGDRPTAVAAAEAMGLLAHVLGLQSGPLRGGPLPVLLYALACLVLYTFIVLALARARDFGPALCVGFGIILALGSNLASQPRYLWLLFPAAVTLARVADRPVLRYALPVVSLVALFVAAAAYARWYFIP